MVSSKDYKYLFALTAQEITSVLYELGTSRRSSSESSVTPAVSPLTSAHQFFLESDLLSEAGHSFSDKGKSLFEALFVYHEEATGAAQIAQFLLCNPVVNLLCQYFYGRGKVAVDQLRTLLNYQQVTVDEVTYPEIISLLILLNKYGIVVYDKKNKMFLVKAIDGSVHPISQYYIQPETPFSNIYNMRKVIRTCRGDVFWIDKHFRKEGFELLLDGLPYEGISSVTIISGADNLTASARADYTALQSELGNRGVSLTWRVINNPSFKWHDRWLVADNQCHNIPPVLAIIRGQRSDILRAKEHLDIESFVSESCPI